MLGKWLRFLQRRERGGLRLVEHCTVFSRSIAGPCLRPRVAELKARIAQIAQSSLATWMTSAVS